MKLPRVRILSQCTARKVADPVLDSEGVWMFAPRLRSAWGGGEAGVFGPDLARAMVPVAELYRGLHHVRVMQGVREYRTAGGVVDLSIISAGYGVIPERVGNRDSMVVPYEATFSGMGKKKLRQVADALRIPEDARDFLGRTGCDVQLVLLGSKYLEACALPMDMELPCPTYVMASPSSKVPSGAIKVSLGQAEARRFSSTLVSLKGVLARRFLALLAQGMDLPLDGDAFLDSVAGLKSHM